LLNHARSFVLLLKIDGSQPFSPNLLSVHIVLS
jgi:hypothetical protein